MRNLTKARRKLQVTHMNSIMDYISCCIRKEMWDYLLTPFHAQEPETT